MSFRKAIELVSPDDDCSVKVAPAAGLAGITALTVGTENEGEVTLYLEKETAHELAEALVEVAGGY